MTKIHAAAIAFFIVIFMATPFAFSESVRTILPEELGAAVIGGVSKISQEDGHTVLMLTHAPVSEEKQKELERLASLGYVGAGARLLQEQPVIYLEDKFEKISKIQLYVRDWPKGCQSQLFLLDDEENVLAEKVLAVPEKTEETQKDTIVVTISFDEPVRDAAVLELDFISCRLTIEKLTLQ